MAEQNLTVTISEAERMELERIIIDRDEKAALVFLVDAVHAKIGCAERGRMKSVFGGGAAPPTER